MTVCFLCLPAVCLCQPPQHQSEMFIMFILLDRTCTYSSHLGWVEREVRQDLSFTWVLRAPLSEQSFPLPVLQVSGEKARQL